MVIRRYMKHWVLNEDFFFGKLRVYHKHQYKYFSPYSSYFKKIIPRLVGLNQPKLSFRSSSTVMRALKLQGVSE